MQIKNRFPHVHKILSSFMNQSKKGERPTYTEIFALIRSQKKSFSK